MGLPFMKAAPVLTDCASHPRRRPLLPPRVSDRSG